jgi:hypothetical protein
MLFRQHKNSSHLQSAETLNLQDFRPDRTIPFTPDWPFETDIKMM